MKTGFVWHECYMWHDTRSAALFMPAGGVIEPDEHAENPKTKRRFRNLLEVSGLSDQLQPITPRPATEDEILRFQTPDYLERIRRASAEGGGDAGELTPFGPGSYEIARLAARESRTLSSSSSRTSATRTSSPTRTRPCAVPRRTWGLRCSDDAVAQIRKAGDDP